MDIIIYMDIIFVNQRVHKNIQGVEEGGREGGG